jgi:hypothetical protein
VGLLVDCCYPLAFKEFLEQLPAKERQFHSLGGDIDHTVTKYVTIVPVLLNVMRMGKIFRSMPGKKYNYNLMYFKDFYKLTSLVCNIGTVSASD